MPKRFLCPDQEMRERHVPRIMNGEYDIPELNLSRPAILDIGANIGAFSVWAANRWPKCTVICYEPHPDNFRLLSQNVTERAEALELAVSGDDGQMFLRDGLHNCGEASLFDLGEQAATGRMVRVIASSRLPQADVIKIDSEGSEVSIVANYSHWKHVKAVMLEWHCPEDRYRLGKFFVDVSMRFYSDVAYAATRGIMKFWRPECLR